MTLPDLDATHDPARRSSVASANMADTPFAIQNLPFGVFAPERDSLRIGVAIQASILDTEAT